VRWELESVEDQGCLHPAPAMRLQAQT